MSDEPILLDGAICGAVMMHAHLAELTLTRAELAAAPRPIVTYRFDPDSDSVTIRLPENESGKWNWDTPAEVPDEAPRYVDLPTATKVGVWIVGLLGAGASAALILLLIWLYRLVL
jgi:hypothetical protein